MPYFQNSDVEIYYEIDGEGPEVIFFAHGFLLNTQMFEWQIEDFKEKYTCVAMDFRGQGLSSVPKSGYEISNLAEDVVALMSYLGKSRIHFVGHSMGGFVGLQLALKHQHLLKSLTLMNTSARAESEIALKNARKTAWFIRLFGINTSLSSIYELMFGETFRNDEELEDEHLIMRNRILSNNKKGILRALRGMLSREDVTSELSRITVPSLVISGTEDKAIPSAHSKELAEGLPNATFQLLPKCGHTPPVEYPDAINQMLEIFWSKI